MGEQGAEGGTSGAEAPLCPVGKQNLPAGLFPGHPAREKWIPVCFGRSQKHPGDVGEGCSGAEGGTSPLVRATVSKHVLLFPPYE